MKYLLFDIDGTLIDSGGCGVRSLNLAFKEIFSIPEGFSGISMAGKTDLQIVQEGMALHKIPGPNGIIPEFFASYVRHLRNSVDPQKGHVKAGIYEALRELVKIDGMVLGLLTGNIEQGAMIKLSAFGLDGYFEAGAFGSDDSDRNRLLPVAVEKLKRRKSINMQYRDCIVIGDTPRDIECARPYGAYSIAVATGPYSFDSLEEAGADMVFSDLSDTERFLDALQQLV